MHRKSAARIIGLCLALAGAAVPGCSRSENARAGNAAARVRHDYNVLLVTLDTTRVDYLSCYDPAKGELTPNIDAVAADGVRFDFAIAQSAGTPMSHASILTGLNPYQHGVRVISAAGGYKLKPGVPTLATILADSGWDTGAFLSAFTVSEYYDFNRGFHTFDNGLTQDPSTVVITVAGGKQRWEQSKHQRRSDVTVERALEWLRSPREKPFFLWIHLWDPHDRMVLPPDDVLKQYVKPGIAGNDRKRAIYTAEVHYVDQQLERVFAELKERGSFEKTIIVIVADHGQGMGQHDWWSHRLLYQEDIHVPLILRGPDWPKGRAVTELARTVDIFPTILEGVGIKPPDGLEGADLRGLMEGRSEPPRMAYSDQLLRYDMASIQISAQRPLDSLNYCAMDRTWKLIYRYAHPAKSELFNLADDPHELRNVAAEHPDEFARLKKYLDACDGYVTREFNEEALPDKETMNKLGALGYVGGAEEDEEGAEDDDRPSGSPESPASQPTTAPTGRP